VTGIVNHDIEPLVIGNDLGDAGVDGVGGRDINSTVLRSTPCSTA
jgi:hypothetical protein